MKNRISREIVYQHTNGDVLKGLRVIEGQYKIRQVVVYKGLYIKDDATYSEDQESAMEKMARQIMFEFASGRTLSAKPFNENIKI